MRWRRTRLPTNRPCHVWLYKKRSDLAAALPPTPRGKFSAACGAPTATQAMPGAAAVEGGARLGRCAATGRVGGGSPRPELVQLRLRLALTMAWLGALHERGVAPQRQASLEAAAAVRDPGRGGPGRGMVGYPPASRARHGQLGCAGRAPRRYTQCTASQSVSASDRKGSPASGPAKSIPMRHGSLRRARRAAACLLTAPRAARQAPREVGRGVRGPAGSARDAPHHPTTTPDSPRPPPAEQAVPGTAPLAGGASVCSHRQAEPSRPHARSPFLPVCFDLPPLSLREADDDARMRRRNARRRGSSAIIHHSQHPLPILPAHHSCYMIPR
jgi:hypothetical protein